jgi:MYXO-CTERM domain-containing protein
VMIPFAHTRERPMGYEKSVEWARLYSDTMQTLYGTLHPAREGYDLAQGQGGGAIDWFRVKLVESFGIELRDGRELAGFQLPADQLIPSVEENWLAFRALALKVAEENGAVVEPSPPVAFTASTVAPAAGCSLEGRPASPPPLLLALLLAAFFRLARRRI